VANVIKLCVYHPALCFFRILPGSYGMLPFGYQLCRPMMGKSIERLLPLVQNSYTLE